MRKLAILTLLGLIVLGLAPFGREVNAIQTPLSPVRNPALAPDFKLKDLKGREHRLSEYRGKVVVVNFWATWCPPCVEEMPSLQKAADALAKDGIAVLGVAVGQSARQVEEFGEKFMIDFPLLPDRESKVMDEWPSHALPTTFVIDTEGRLAYRAVGARDWSDPIILEPIRALRKN